MAIVFAPSGKKPVSLTWTCGACGHVATFGPSETVYKNDPRFCEHGPRQPRLTDGALACDPHVLEVEGLERSTMSAEHYVRAYNPVTDTEEWHGPLPAHMAHLVAEGLHGKWQTRVYHRSELPGDPAEV